MSVFLTAKFKVHNPSKRKQAALDTALEQYTYAYQYLLDWCRENLDTLDEKGQSNGRYRETLVRGQLPKRSSLPEFQLHNSMYDALLIDVAGAITSYLSLKVANPDTGFPTCRDPNPEGYPNALDEFASSIGDLTEENEKRSRLLKLSKGSVMPVYFSRPDAVPRMRNFSLMWDAEKERFSAVVYIAPKDRLEPLVPAGNLQRMGWASRTGDPEAPRPKLTAVSRSALILNLEMGRWHRGKFLDPSLAGEANVRSAFLSRDETKKGKDYYLHVTFEYAPEAIEPETYIGVDRGLANLIGITVIDKAGKILHQELHSGEELKAYQRLEFLVKKRLQKRGKDLTGRANVWRRDEEICHGLANTIVDVAKRYRSQVVMEYLVGFKERKRDFGALKRSPLQRIEQILDYKLPLASLPPLRTVGAAYTSQRCPKCDYTDRKNRVTQADFRCQQCGYETHADLNGGHNIALKWLNRPSTKKASTLTAA
jgi:hypothetical protein